MAQFSMIPERKKILEAIPDYAVTISPALGKVTVKAHGRTIAESAQALLVEETRHADVYYLPREDVDFSLLSRTDHSTYCPFKGHASYWTLEVDGAEEANVVWSYEDPYPEVMDLKDYVSFYANRVDVSEA